MRRLKNIFRVSVIVIAVCVLTHVFCDPVQALEAGSYRLLSISKTERLVLVSRIPDQRRFLLDAAEVKITINDEPAEFEELTSFTVVQVEMELRRTRRKGVNLDGYAREIAISDPTER